jgi:hypothetical protein
MQSSVCFLSPIRDLARGEIVTDVGWVARLPCKAKYPSEKAAGQLVLKFVSCSKSTVRETALQLREVSRPCCGAATPLLIRFDKSFRL